MCGCRQLGMHQIANTSAAHPGLSIPQGISSVFVLIILNIVWNGLGNLAVGDTRGWKYGFFNWACAIASLALAGIPCIAWCVYCSVKGYEHLKAQGAISV